METLINSITENSEIIPLFIFFSLLYFWLTGFKMQRLWTFYFGGLTLMVIAILSSHIYAHSMQFTVHMIIHVLLLLACAPLLVIGWPKKTNTHPVFLRKTYHFLLRHPLFCWITGIGMMWFWHIPSILKALMISHQQSFSFLVFAHIASLLIAGIIFTWPIVNPQRNFRIYPPLGIVYLFTACIACSLLGLLITFAPSGIYSHSMDAIGSTGAMSMNTETDQQTAGLIMWVPCCFLYLFGVLYLLFKWLKEPDTIKTRIKKPVYRPELLIPENND